MKRYFYDFEFLEDGRTIEPISLGIVCDDGREYYAVFRDAPWRRVKKHAWLMANVVPLLPKKPGPLREYQPKSWLFNYDDAAVKSHEKIAEEVERFLRGPNEPIELWGYFAAYDHVALAQLWGPMVNWPPGIPMWTNDVQQLAEMWELEGFIPEQPPNAHNALADARWTMKAYEVLQEKSAAGLQRFGTEEIRQPLPGSYDFRSSLTGGPCPACGNTTLVRDRGTYGPGELRTLTHADGAQCQIPLDAGYVFADGSGWRWIPGLAQ